MKQGTVNTIKLGSFIIAGLAFLVLMLYFIGKNQDLFRKTFTVKARFGNVQGLRKGNNVRYAGIEAGTVGKVEVVNDSLIEITLQLKKELHRYIRKNAMVSIGTDGLMGSPIVNIRPTGPGASFIEAGDVLPAINLPETGDMLQVLNTTNNDIAAVAAEVKNAMKRFNNSKAVWTILEDESLPKTVKRSLANIQESSMHLAKLMIRLEHAAAQLREGSGAGHVLLYDTTVGADVREAIAQVRAASTGADTLAQRINALVSGIQYDLETGKGTAHELLKNEKTTAQLQQILENLKQGTQSFNESMEALQHNFLLRGYFKKQKKPNATDADKSVGY